jgi:GAF domain-containing protein
LLPTSPNPTCFAAINKGLPGWRYLFGEIMTAQTPSTQKLSALKHSTDIQCHFLRTLSKRSKRDEVLQYIVEQLTKILDASACSIYIVDKGGKTATQRAGDGYQRDFVGIAKCQVVPADQVVDNHPAPDQRLGITGWIISTGKSFLARNPEEVLNHPHRQGIHDPDMSPDRKLQLQTFLGVPVRGLHGEIIGAIKAERRLIPESVTHEFVVEEQIVLETVARMTSKALGYLETARTRSVDAAITAWARDVISEASYAEGELDGFLSLIVNVAAAAMHADSCGLYLTDPSKNTLTQRAGTGSQQPRYVIRSYSLPKKEAIPEHPKTEEEKVGLTAWIAAMGKPFYAPNFTELHKHPHHRGAYDKHNFVEGQEICGAFLGVPLQVAGDIIGTLKVENISHIGKRDPRVFNEEARRRFDVLAQDIALATRRLQTHATDPYQVIINAQDTLFQILRGGQDVQTLVSTVVKKTMELLKARACALFLKEGDMLVQPDWAAGGYYYATFPGRRREYKLVKESEILNNPKKDQKVGLTVWIAVKRKKFTARSNTELKLHPHHRGTFDPYNFKPGEQCESFMGVPLEVGGELIGVLKVESKKKITDGNEEYTYFNEQDELVFDLIAMSVSIAIENAKLSESRRFAERILVQQNRLLPDLHEFVKENSQAVETLTQVANLISGRNKNIANIIEKYATLLQPDFPERFLDAIPSLMKTFGDFLEGGQAMGRLYEEFYKALNISKIEELSSFCADSSLGTDVQFVQANFFLAEPATLFIETISQVYQALQGAPATRSSLETARAHVEAAKNRAEKLYPPEGNILLRIFDRWLGAINIAKETFEEVSNPYIVGKPVDPSASTFFGRQDVVGWIAKNISKAEQKNILVFLGERRMGKTSILLQLHKGKLGKELRQNMHRPICSIYIDLQGYNDWKTYQVLHKLCREITEQVVAYDTTLTNKLHVPARKNFEKIPFDTFQEYLSQVCSSLNNTLLVLMIDEFEVLDKMVADGSLDKKIFIQLRNLMQHQPALMFIMAGAHRLEELSLEYRELVQSIALIREVSFISKKDSEALIRQPVAGKVNYEPTAVEELWQNTHGHPYLLQYLCHELIDDMNHRGEGNYINKGHVTKIIQELVSKRETYLNTLWEGCPSLEKAVLYCLAEATHVHKSGLEKHELAEQLPTYSEVQISDTLARLIKRGLLEMTEAEKYTHTILLFSLWIHRNVPAEQKGN